MPPEPPPPPDERAALTGRNRWAAIVGVLLTLAMAAGLARQLLGSGLRGFDATVPGNPVFYIAFAALYAAPPLADHVIFRRLWDLPRGALGALVRKRIANEVLFGYAGEAYFFAWAKAHARDVAGPFAGIKDVSILSAMAGNATTLIATLAALPFAGALLSGAAGRTLLISAAIVVATSLPFILFRKRVFSLPGATLWWVFGVHVARIVAGTLLLALCWAAALPAVGAGVWLMLAAVRLLFSRLPLVPNKDLLFANFAILYLGPAAPLSGVIAFTAALTLVVHVALIVGFGGRELIRRGSR